MTENPYIETWRKRKTEVKAQNKKLMRRLSKSKDKKLNKRVDELHDTVFEKVDCLECANCCTSIPPLLNETDVRRAAKALGMKPAQFKDEYTRVDEDGDTVMNQTPCPFLGAGNLCDIYDSRPKACRQYPHTDNQEFLKNAKLHATNAVYCPAVFHILEALKKSL